MNDISTTLGLANHHVVKPRLEGLRMEASAGDGCLQVTAMAGHSSGAGQGNEGQPMSIPFNPKRCPHCKGKMEAGMRIHPECIDDYATETEAKKAREKAKRELMADKVDKALTKQKLSKLKTKAQWAKEAQAAFNKFIRLRDADLPCISCGRHHGGQYHAGHFLSVGARPELRFEETNVFKQCAPCNTHLSGNAVLFRKGLMAKLGIELVEWLEGPHEPRRDTVDTLAALKREYTAKARALEAAQ